MLSIFLGLGILLFAIAVIGSLGNKAVVEEAEIAEDTLTAESHEYVDLGLPSGTLWKSSNENDTLYDYDSAMSEFGDKLPTREQWEELKEYCTWTWTGSGYKVTGSNGKSIVLPAAGYRSCNGCMYSVGSNGYYWSSSPSGSERAWGLLFNSDVVSMYSLNRCYGLSVRLVQD